MRNRWHAIGVSALAALALSTTPAAGHDLKGDLQQDGEQLEVRAFYPPRQPAAEATVEVRNASGCLVASGRTDSRGRWAFPQPGPGKYLIVIDAGDGHQKVMSLTVVHQPASVPPPGTLASGVYSIPRPAEGITGAPPGTHASESYSIHVENRDDPEEAGRFPWLKAAIGIAAISALGLGLWLTRRNR